MKRDIKANKGQSLKYSTVAHFFEVVQEYLDNCILEEKPMTITGLCLYMGFNTVKTFYDYRKKKFYGYVCDYALLNIHNYLLNQLSQGKNVKGSFIVLKNMFPSDWKESQEIVVGDLPNDIEVAMMRAEKKAKGRLVGLKKPAPAVKIRKPMSEIEGNQG